jgi:hypothetical protein
MGWPFDEITTEHLGLALVMLITAIGLWIKAHTDLKHHRHFHDKNTDLPE